MILSILFGWTRLATGSVWLRVAHGTINSFGAVVAVLAPRSDFDTAYVTLQGLTCWLLPLAFIAFLSATGWLPVRDPR